MNVCYESAQIAVLAVQSVAMIVAAGIALKNNRDIYRQSIETIKNIDKQLDEREAQQERIGQQIQQTKEKLDSLVERMKNAGYYD